MNISFLLQRLIIQNTLGGDNISNLAKATIAKVAVKNYREPSLEDGAEVRELIKDIKILDLNSSYSYIMWCSYFSETSIIIETDNKIVGFISGFIKPTEPDRIFVWQVAVAESERGRGLASKMLRRLLERESCEGINYKETTVTQSNIPSQKIFHGLARDLGTKIKESECFTCEDCQEKGHEDELIHEISPFKIR